MRVARLTPGPDEIELEVLAVGLNFRDVLNVMDLYPGDPGPPGADCAGIVTRVGKTQNRFKIGDIAFGLAPGSLRPFVTAPAKLMGHLPQGWAFEEGSALPVAQITVEYAFTDIARLDTSVETIDDTRARRGSAGVMIGTVDGHHVSKTTKQKKVLIHAGSGGVGLFAIQYCQRVGAEIYCTVGSDFKRDYLTKLGVKYISSSRDPAQFKTDMEQWFEQEDQDNRLDVVLNCLAGDYIQISVRYLNSGGYFLELGKLRTWTVQQMESTRPDIHYHLIAVDSMVERDYMWYAQQLDRLSSLCEKGLVKPIMVNCFPITRGQEAFRFLQKARHIGKVVITLPHIIGGLVPPLPAEEGLTPEELSELGRPYLRRASMLKDVIIITGGTGALGSVIAEWLIYDMGMKHIVLLSRSGRNPLETEATLDATTQERWKHITESNAKVDFIRCDVSNGDDLRSVFDKYFGSGKESNVKLNGIIHAAGLIEDIPFRQMTHEQFARVLHSKIDCLPVFEEVLSAFDLEQSLKFFVLFSSVASMLGNAGQTNYATANAILDSYAKQRRAQGKVCISLQWGPWTQQGMAANLVSLLARVGMKGINNSLGLRVLMAALVYQDTFDVLGVETIRWKQYLSSYDHVPNLFVEVAADSGTNKELDKLSRELLKMSPEALHDHVFSVVVNTAVEVTGRKVEDGLDLDQPITESGIDSLAAVEFGNELSNKLGVKLSPTTLFDYPTLNGIAGYVYERIASSVIVSSGDPTSTSGGVVDLLEGDDGGLIMGPDQSPLAERPISKRLVYKPAQLGIIGAACRMPKRNWSLSSFWEMMLNRTDCISYVPESRFDIGAFYDENPLLGNRCYVREAGFMDDVDLFDNKFFNISPAEVAVMDPQQRILLEVAYECLLDARFNRKSVAGKCFGVYIGCCNFDWHCTDATSRCDSTFSSTGIAASIIANRVSYALGLIGPSLVIDTACSSSLVALEAAINHISIDDTIEGSIVGGVNIIAAPHAFVAFCKTRMLAPDGRCKTFDASADGYGRGEGCGTVLVMPLKKAKGRRVHAIIRGAAVNHDGKSASLTAPNGRAQRACLASTLVRSGVSASDVVYLECHGTGTALGDPIECSAIRAIYLDGVRNDVAGASVSPLLLGALKTNIGHLEGAAGIAGILKGILVLKNRLAPPLVHFTKLNPHIKFDGVKVAIPTEIEDLEVVTGRLGRSNPRFCAAVSSFGFGGANAHIILEEPSLRMASWALDSQQERLKSKSSGIVYLFTGQGSQYVGMGKKLYEVDEIFHASVDRVLALFGELGEEVRAAWLIEPQEGQTTGRSIDDTTIAQVALFTLEVALVELLQSKGITPQMAVGHSLGEYLTAIVCGVLSVENAAKIVKQRALLMGSVSSEDPVMCAVRVSEQEAMEAITACGHKSTAVATINGPRSIVLSGCRQEVVAVLEFLKQPLDKTRFLAVSNAFHSPLMIPARDQLFGFLSSLMTTPSEAANSTVFISTVTGTRANLSTLLTPEYWADQITKPVRFADAIACAAQMGGSTFIEIGPKPTLINMGKLAYYTEETNLTQWAACLQPHQDDCASIENVVSLIKGEEFHTWNHVAFPWEPVGNDSEEPLKLCLPKKPRTSKEAVVNNMDSEVETAEVCESTHRVILAAAEETFPGVVITDFEAPIAEALAGVDSLAAVEFREKLNEKLGIDIPVTILFDHASLKDMEAHLVKELLAHRLGTDGERSPTTMAMETKKPQESLAIVGVGCSFPKNARSPNDVWNNIKQKFVPFEEVPLERYNYTLNFERDMAKLTTTQTNSKYVALVDDPGVTFPCSFFHIPSKEASCVDPQQRLAIRCAYEAFLRSGHDLKSLYLEDCGVFAGCSDQEWQMVSVLNTDQTLSDINSSSWIFTGAAQCMLANRISYTMKLRGPSMTVDTGCSSFVSALSMAADALVRGRVNLALALGVSLILSPVTAVGFSQMRYLTSDKYISVFDAASNGTLRGEGCGAFVIKRLREALGDGDKLYGCIKSVAVNAAGGAPTLTAFHTPSHEQVIKQALYASKVQPADVDFVEAHGTGIPIGDAVEFSALKQVFARSRWNEDETKMGPPLIVTSPHPYLGHSNGALGAAQLMKALLSIHHQEIPALINFTKPHPFFDLKKFPVQFAARHPIKLRSGGRPLISVINSFGMGGANGCIVLSAPTTNMVKDEGWGPVTDPAYTTAPVEHFRWTTPDPLLALSNVHIDSPTRDLNKLKSAFDTIEREGVYLKPPALRWIVEVDRSPALIEYRHLIITHESKPTSFLKEVIKTIQTERVQSSIVVALRDNRYLEEWINLHLDIQVIPVTAGHSDLSLFDSYYNSVMIIPSREFIGIPYNASRSLIDYILDLAPLIYQAREIILLSSVLTAPNELFKRNSRAGIDTYETDRWNQMKYLAHSQLFGGLWESIVLEELLAYLQCSTRRICIVREGIPLDTDTPSNLLKVVAESLLRSNSICDGADWLVTDRKISASALVVHRPEEWDSDTVTGFRVRVAASRIPYTRQQLLVDCRQYGIVPKIIPFIDFISNQTAHASRQQAESLSQMVHRLLSPWFLTDHRSVPNLDHVTLPSVTDRPVTLRIPVADIKEAVEVTATSSMEVAFAQRFDHESIVAEFTSLKLLPPGCEVSNLGLRAIKLLLAEGVKSGLSFAGMIALRPWMTYVLQNLSIVEYLLKSPEACNIPELNKDPVFVIGPDRMVNMVVAGMLSSDTKDFTSVSFEETLIPFGPMGRVEWGTYKDLDAGLDVLITTEKDNTYNYAYDQLMTVRSIVSQEFSCLFPETPDGYWEDTLIMEMLGLSPSYLMKFHIEHTDFIRNHIDYAYHRLLLRLIMYRRQKITGYQENRRIVLTSPYHLLGLNSLMTTYPGAKILYVPSGEQGPLWLFVELSKKFQLNSRRNFDPMSLKQAHSQVLSTSHQESRQPLKNLLSEGRLFVLDKAQLMSRPKDVYATIRHFLGYKNPTQISLESFEFMYQLVLDQILPGNLNQCALSRTRLVGRMMSTVGRSSRQRFPMTPLKYNGIPWTPAEWHGLMRVCLRKNVTSTSISALKAWLPANVTKGELDPRVVYKQMLDQEIPNLIDMKVTEAEAPAVRDVILVTGATGFFGRYLLHRLIVSQDDVFSTLKIKCLIRSHNGVSAKQRLEDTFRAAHFDVPILDRVEVIESNLEASFFGLDHDTYQQLASRVAMVFHAAGRVEMLGDFHQLYGSNVLSTLEVLKFIAVAHRPKVFFVSSQAAFPGGLASGSLHLDLYREDAVPQCMLEIPDFETKGNGYAWAKQMCEMMMRQASELLGFELAIFRLPHIFFAHDPAAINYKDGMTHVIMTGLELGMISERNVDLMDTVATEDVATIMVEIARHPDSTRVSSLSEESIENAYHLCRGNHPSQFLNMDDIQSIARVMGVSLKVADETEINEAAVRRGITLHGYAAYNFASDRLPTVQEAISAGIYTMPTSFPLANTKRLHISYQWKPTALVWGAAVKHLLMTKAIPSTSNVLCLRGDDIIDLGHAALKQKYENRGMTLSLPLKTWARTHLEDENWALEPLEIFRRDVYNHPLTSLGRVFAKKMVQQWYCNLLLLQDTEKERPDILAQEIVPNPVFIVGLNRSGTTFLYHAMAVDRDTFRAPLLMELAIPFGLDCSYEVPAKPIPKERDPVEDPRKQECDLHLQLASIPNWELIHQTQSHLPEEDYLIFDYAGRSFSFSIAYEAPSYLEWLTKNNYANLRDGYKTHKRYLKHLQAQRETPRWLIKGPWHMLTMDTLFETYPDAKIIYLQRDPVPAVHSWLNLVYAFRSSLSNDQDHSKWAMDETRREAAMIHRFREYREANPEFARERIIDVNFSDLTADPKKVMKQIYEFLDEPYTATQDGKLDEYLCTDAEWRQEASKQEKKPLEFFGLTEQSVRSLFPSQ